MRNRATAEQYETAANHLVERSIRRLRHPRQKPVAVYDGVPKHQPAPRAAIAATAATSVSVSAVIIDQVSDDELADDRDQRRPVQRLRHQAVPGIGVPPR
jgi:hypothetical protein